ncbi:MAG TPA: DUF1707 domain-containing protein [Iamia sp.]
MDDGRALTDADRETAVAALRRHAGDGVIDLDQFGDRTAAVLAAATVGELDPVFADLPGGLPALPVPARAPAPAVRPRRRPAFPLVTRLAPVAPLALLFVAIWAVSGFGYFWPIWPIMGISIGALKHGRAWGCAGRRRTYWA